MYIVHLIPAASPCGIFCKLTGWEASATQVASQVDAGSVPGTQDASQSQVEGASGGGGGSSSGVAAAAAAAAARE